MSDPKPPKVLWIKDPYLQLILQGLKTIEVRVGYSNILHLQPGDRLLLNEQHLFILRRITVYSTFEDLLSCEDPDAIAPGLPPARLLEALREIYPPEKEALGAVAMQVEAA